MSFINLVLLSVDTQRFAKSPRVLIPCGDKNTAQHTKRNNCMFKNVLQ